MKTDSAMVVTAHPLASDVGVEIMRQGGNAIDAAIATQFALAVVCPRAGNIGGGGFLVLRMADGTREALDFREKAPLAAHKDMYLDSLDNPVSEWSREGHLSVGVPGTVAGMVAAHKKYGALKDWKTLLAPAIRLAKEGFPITQSEADRLNKYRPDFIRINENAAPFVKDTPWHMGDWLRQPELAATLERIQANKADGFYKGKTADLLLREMQRGKGIITQADLDKYEAKWRKPLEAQYKKFNIITMPPPSSGGVALIQMLQILEFFPVNNLGQNQPEAIHLMVEAMRRAYADRAVWLGDSDFYPIPIDTLLDRAYLMRRMGNFHHSKATPSDTLQAGNFTVLQESFETTHTSVVDPDGNAVAVTTTLNLNYGSKILVAGGGFFLNDEMDDFSAKPGTPNFFGLVGAEANAIAPEKRMLSSMTPTIVEEDGELMLVLGTPGGSTIITSVLQVFLNIAEFGFRVPDAVNAPRFHHQWLPDEVWYERHWTDSLTRQKVANMGHRWVEKEALGKVKAIHVLGKGHIEGAGDFRNADDDVSGW